MIIITGAAGFIGANLAHALNARGRADLLLVDEVELDDAKRANLADLRYQEYIGKEEFLAALQSRWTRAPVAAVLHQGACSDTMETDRDYVLRNNFAYSQTVYEFCARQQAQFIYASSASVYGGGSVFVESAENESALNYYAESKLKFDAFIRARLAEAAPAIQRVGLRYFNVYGPREAHKGRMASVAWHFFRQYQRDGCVQLFAGGDGYADGEQRRDFVSVDDIVAVNLFFLDNPTISGIYNAGTGRSASFNDVALAVINACRGQAGEAEITLADATAAGAIDYIAMPDALRGKYQSYTQADLSRLRAAGYDADFADVRRGVGDYARAMLG